MWEALHNGGALRWRKVATRLGRGCAGTRTRARYLMRGERDRHKRGDPDAPRRGKRWTAQEEAALWERRGDPLEEVAVCHGRSPCAVACRLILLRKRKAACTSTR